VVPVTDPLVVELAKNYDSTDDSVAENPYPVWERFRSSGSVLRSEQLGGFHLVTRYEDVRSVIGDYERFVSSQKVAMPPILGPQIPPVEFDPPEHRDMRQPLNAWFSPQATLEMEPEIRELAVELIEPMLEREQVDLMDEFAGILPRLVVMRLLGLPDGDREMLAEWVHCIERLRSTDPDRVRAATGDFLAYLSADLEDRRRAPRETRDIVASLMTAAIDGQPIADDVLLLYYFNLVMSGLGTTTAALALLLRHLAGHPDAAAMLRAHPERLDPAIEELLRVYTPTQALGRTAAVDTEINGCPIKAGDKVQVVFGSANHDPEEFPDADEVILDRKPNRHLAFGGGVHRCIGSNLARRILRVGIEEILARFGEFRLTDPAAIRWEMNGTELRTLAALPVTRKAG
jgi:cytochrome P450